MQICIYLCMYTHMWCMCVLCARPCLEYIFSLTTNWTMGLEWQQPHLFKLQPSHPKKPETKRRSHQISAEHENQAGHLQHKCNNFIYAPFKCKHPLGTQDYKRQGVGSSSIFSEHSTSSQPSDLLQQTWPAG